jgi:hypothetical protein
MITAPLFGEQVEVTLAGFATNGQVKVRRVTHEQDGACFAWPEQTRSFRSLHGDPRAIVRALAPYVLEGVQPYRTGQRVRIGRPEQSHLSWSLSRSGTRLTMPRNGWRGVVLDDDGGPLVAVRIDGHKTTGDVQVYRADVFPMRPRVRRPGQIQARPVCSLRRM